MKIKQYFFLAIAVVFPALYAVPCSSQVTAPVKVSEGTLTIPTYEPSGRELEPALFPSSTVTGLYPFPTYLPTFTRDSPKPKTYSTVVLENEYLKLTYIPEFGGRFFSLYDKIRKREVFYRNDVIKPTMFNPHLSWPVFGIELTGPFDVHMLTLHGEPYWSHTIVHHNDGSVSLVLGELDPVYHMKVNLSATLYPGIAAMQISVFCYNRNDSQMPQMLWLNADLRATEKTRFVYPMTRTVGHVSGQVSSWPLYNGIDLSWDKNNQNMLGVFGIDSYDNFAGAYEFDNDFGVFRYADRRIVQGMKLWTFGHGAAAKPAQEALTDHAGPCLEVQSGRYVWDGHYEWVAPHEVESWNEWWIPVAGIGGLTTMTRDVALNLTVQSDPAGTNSQVTVALSPARRIENAKLTVAAKSGEILSATVALIPGTPVKKSISGIKADAEGLKELTVRIVDSSGTEVLNYVRPDENPGRKEYSAFAKGLEQPQKSPDKMSVEELVEAAEFKLKEMDPGAMLPLVDEALKRDPGYSRAHLLLGIFDYNNGHYQQAADELTKATNRDPYLDEAWYYLAISQLAAGDSRSAERNLYYIEPDSAYFGEREYQLGKLALTSAKPEEAASHFERAVVANGDDLNARALLALTLRGQGKKAEAAQQLDGLLRVDPANRLAYAERYLVNGDPAAKSELLRLMGEQSQEALDVAIFYQGVGHWRDAAKVLQLVEHDNKDPWGTSPLIYYTLAYDLDQSGDRAMAATYRRKARAASGVVDRFPYRRESEALLAAAVKADPRDAGARFELGCLLYYLQRPDEAIAQWQAAIAVDPKDFSARRALGLAYSEQGKMDEAIAQLENAVDLRPDHIRTFNDLSAVYARAGRFDDQVALLRKALQRSPTDDDLYMALLNSYMIQRHYEEANEIVRTHVFAPRHRSTTLRDEYRDLCYGMGAEAFNKGDYAKALSLFQSILKPPASLSLDDFQSEPTPKAHYYIGRTLEALGRKQDAQAAYLESTRGIEFLSGDRDSWSRDNFFAVLALEKLGRTAEAQSLVPHFEGFARTEMDYANPEARAHARYLLALVAKHAGETAEARTLMSESLAAAPDFLAPRFELRGDAIDPLQDAGASAENLPKN